MHLAGVSRLFHRRIVGEQDTTHSTLARVEKLIGTGFADKAVTVAGRESEALLGHATGGAGSLVHMRSPLNACVRNKQRGRAFGGARAPAPEDTRLREALHGLTAMSFALSQRRTLDFGHGAVST